MANAERVLEQDHRPSGAGHHHGHPLPPNGQHAGWCHAAICRHLLLHAHLRSPCHAYAPRPHTHTHDTTHADLSRLNQTAAIPKILGERAVFYREHAARTYNSLVYAASIILPELPFAVITAVLYTYATFLSFLTTFWSHLANISIYCGYVAHTRSIPLYFISGLQYDADRYFIFFGIFLLTNLLAISLCHIIGLLSPNVVIANSLSAILFTLFSLLAGFLITRDDIGGWWIWMHYIGSSLTHPHSFLSHEYVVTMQPTHILCICGTLFHADINMFALEVLMINEFEGLKLHCTGHEFAQVPIASQPGVFKEFCGITTGEEYLDSVRPAPPRPPLARLLVAHACAINQFYRSVSRRTTWCVTPCCCSLNCCSPKPRSSRACLHCCCRCCRRNVGRDPERALPVHRRRPLRTPPVLHRPLPPAPVLPPGNHFSFLFLFLFLPQTLGGGRRRGCWAKRWPTCRRSRCAWPSSATSSTPSRPPSSSNPNSTRPVTYFNVIIERNVNVVIITF